MRGRRFCLFRFPFKRNIFELSGFENTACELKLGEKHEIRFDRMVNRYGTDCYKWDMITKRKLDPNTLPLWVADMDFETVPEVKERLKEVADRGIYGYSMLGDGYYDALKNWFSTRFNWQIENDWVIATPGVVFALAAAVRAYTKEGDSVMIQRPVYHRLQMW